MQTRLLKRGRDSGRIDDNPAAIANRLNFYKYNTLPVMKYFDDQGKLVVVSVVFCLIKGARKHEWFSKHHRFLVPKGWGGG